jgi:hypothetical protein
MVRSEEGKRCTGLFLNFIGIQFSENALRKGSRILDNTTAPRDSWRALGETL